MEYAPEYAQYPHQYGSHFGNHMPLPPAHSTPGESYSSSSLSQQQQPPPPPPPPPPPAPQSASHHPSPESYPSSGPPDPLPTYDYPSNFHSSEPPSHLPNFAGLSSGLPTPPKGLNIRRSPQHLPPKGLHQPLGHHSSMEMGGMSHSTMGMEDGHRGRGGSEDDDSLTPQQHRRKAQNRAAQRAFRERKEKHIKNLEARLAESEAAQQRSTMELERLRRDLHKMSTENEMLRANSGCRHSRSKSPEAIQRLPVNHGQADFYSNVLQNYTDKKPSHHITMTKDGEKVLAAGAAWDYIMSHDLFKKGLVDVEDVSQRLKSLLRSDGQGPTFSETAINQAIQQSIASGSDDLL